MASLYEKLKNVKLVRKLVYVFIGSISYPRLVWLNRLKISGFEHIKNLPSSNVLFVSNHQTYFMDVIVFLHIFCAVKWRKKNKLGVPYYLLNPFTRVYFVSAEDTMKKTFMSRLMALAGAITVKRTWVEEDKSERKGLNLNDYRKITKALQNNWVITFPQGTTTPFAAGRKGTALVAKQNKSIVIPIVIDGFNKAFHKKSLKLLKTGTTLTVRIKPPMVFDYETESLDVILSRMMDAIEQSNSFKTAANAS